MVIRIIDYIQSASSYEDGQVIFELIKKNLLDHKSVVLSFESITSVPSAFINSALLQLLDEFTFEEIKEKLAFENTTKNINNLIRSRFDFVLSKSHKRPYR